jgi:hypothetical protein
MGRRTRQHCAPEAVPDGAMAPVPPQVLPSEVVRVPVRAILYLQAMAENGHGDRPKPLGPAFPCGHVCYQQ